MNRTVKAFAAAAVVAFGATLAAQSAPDIAYDSVPDLLKPPLDLQLGEIGGVGQTSKGDIFVYSRMTHPYGTLADNRTFAHNGSKLLQFDKTGRFVRSLGDDVYGFNAAIGLRVDPQDNVWVIDELSNQVIKVGTNGQVALVLGRKPENIAVRPGPVPGAPPPAAGGGGGEGGGRGGPPGPPGAGTPGSTFQRPQDVAWDKAGNIYIAEGMANINRVEKFDKDGRFIRQWGSTGTENGQFRGVKSIVIDANDNVYVADIGNKRIQVFDSNGTFKTAILGVGTPQTLCITKGATQYLYVSHVGDPNGMDDAAIYKLSLDGKMVGKFGSAGRLPKQFGVANSIDCRNENELLIGEMTNWRVQKVSLRAAR